MDLALRLERPRSRASHKPTGAAEAG